jgi:hypothetical protein
MHRPDSAARRGFVVPALWAAAIDARRANLARNPEASWERRRADERELWVGSLDEAVDVLALAVGLERDGQSVEDVDPADALAGVVAVCSAWYDAMSGRPGVTDGPH